MDRSLGGCGIGSQPGSWVESIASHGNTALVRVWDHACQSSMLSMIKEVATPVLTGVCTRAGVTRAIYTRLVTDNRPSLDWESRRSGVVDRDGVGR